MADFSYLALSMDGAEKRGRIKADGEADARAKLIAKGYHVLEITSASMGQGAGVSPFGSRTRKLSGKELALFTRQLSSIISVSPLEEALRTLSRQNEKLHVRAILENVHAGLVEGQSLAEAMKRQPKSFPALYRAMISAGENSSALPLIMERLAILLERQVEMRGKLIGALVYPAVLALVALVVVALLMITVVPRVVEQFDGVDQQLPFITRAVIAASAFLGGYWYIILAIIAAMALLVTFLHRTNPDFRYQFDAMLLKLPLIGKLLRNLNAAKMARTLATMVESRLPVLQGLQLTSRTISNSVLRRASEQMVEAIRSGGSLSATMRTAGVFPPLLVYLAASGESAGQLGTMLERTADYLEREFDDFTSTALTLLEPIIIVFMGGAVAVIILAILLPILQLQSLIGS